MKNIYLLCLLTLLFHHNINAQMPGTGKYGNEWIRYGQSYYKIPVAQDGIYRINYETLVASGFPVPSVSAPQYQLWHFGEQVPIYTSTEGILSNSDYIEFYGKKNRGELDRFLYKNGEADMLNPGYSMFTDTAAYFLTYVSEGSSPLRYTSSSTDLTNLPAKEEWFLGDTLINPSGSFVEKVQGEAIESVFEFGEGFGTVQELDQTYEINLNSRFRYQNIAADSFQFRIVGIGTNAHDVQIRINNELLGRSIKSPANVNQVWNESFTHQHNSSQENINIKILDTIGRIAISSIKMFYPRAFNFEGRNQYYFKLNGNGTEKHLEITNFNAQGDFVILYDLTTQRRIEAKVTENKVRIKLDAFTGKKEFYLVDPVYGVNLIKNNSVNKEAFLNLPQIEGDYIIITSRKLRQDNSGVDQAQQYADYRRSPQGGSYRPVVINIEDLYDHFAYGIQRHPLAVRNFGHYIKKEWASPKFVLILGKAQEFDKSRNYNANIDAHFFVPTLGVPGSDNLLLASNDSQVPIIPIGRIAATEPADIALYLEKIKEYENPSQSAEDRSWRKEIIHLGGGRDEGQQYSIRLAMDNLKRTISESKYGANISTYSKRGNDITQRLESEEINRLLQQGVGVITFFGHGGYNVIEISIGEANTYTNYKKYPVMFALGCYSGNIHTSGISYSENFVFQSKKAGIAFIGTASEGNLSDLSSFQQTVYRHLGETSYGKSIGEIVKASIQQHDANLSPYHRALLQQFTLHGDPALKINPIDAPDYLVDQKSVGFNPSTVSIREEGFNLKFNVLNIGKNINDSLSLKITRRLPTGVQKIVRDTIKAPAYQSELLTYQFPVDDSSGSTAGFNEFLIELDPNNNIKELPDPEAENNNELRDIAGVPGIKLFIFDKGITPIQPLNYSIVNDAPLKLQASTANVFETVQRYRIAIDTTKYFNSPIKLDTIINTTGGVLDWQPDIKLLDSTVYYWRVAIDSLIEGEYNWMTSSFTYIKDSPLGWRQGHFQQLQENIFQEMSLPDSTQKLSFAPNPSNVKFNVFQYPLPGYSYTVILEYSSMNLTPTQYVGGIGSGGVIISVLDGNSGNPWYNVQPGKFGSVVGESWAWLDGVNNFPFPTTTPQARKRVIDFLRDSIPDGHYVLLYTIQHTGEGIDYKPEQWAADSLTIGTNLFKVLNAEGATMIDSTATKGARPYAIFYRKGSGKPIFEELANSVQDTVFGSYTIPGFKTEGNIYSRKVGPAKKWTRLQQNLETDEYDNYDITLYGIREDQTKTSLITNFTAADTSLEWINTDLYPYLELALNARDSINRTPPQFGYWQVLYEGMPEAALNPLAHFNMPKDTIQEGESLIVDIAISNLSAYDMDSLLVYYTTTSETNQVHRNPIWLKPLPKQDTILFNLRLPSQDLQGKYQLLIEINPTEDQPDQPELYHFNNIGVLDFYVQGDVRNPLVDVTFDGMRILNGDLVSAKPQIVVSVRDENPYLALMDTATIKLSLLYPNQNSAKPIAFDQVRFEPGKPDGKGKKATIYFEPELVEDGTYTLLVNGQDASGNEAGKIHYQVEFEVITKAMISNVFTYPNPFTTSTQFVYTLTGAEPPSQYKIQIMSVSGRIVRELTELDLGPLRIGMHRTELAWDGTDQYGDRLANGVYLYRVIAKDQDGKDYEKYNDGNGTDRFFKKNIGKLVILR